MSNAHNIMYSTKTEPQTSYKTQNDSSSFRIPLKNENNSVVGPGLVVRRFTRNARLINSLHDKGMSISNLRALQIETALANCLIDKLEGSSSAKCLLPFLVDGEFVCFHFDNVDKCIDTQDGKNQLHGGLIVVFQAKMEEREVQRIWHDADLTSMTLKVKDTDFTFVKEYPAPNYKRKSILPRSTEIVPSNLTPTSELMPWLLLKSQPDINSSTTPPFSGYYSSIHEVPHCLTNIGALPIIPNPVHEWGTLYTALDIMKKINDDVVGTGVKTTISLDLALYEKILQLVYSDVNLKEKFILRLGELHISMAHFRGIGNYMSSSGIENIWIESGVYGPATTRSIIRCTHYKRTFQAHEDTLIALFSLFINKFYEEFPAARQKFNDIEINKNNKDNFCLLVL